MATLRICMLGGFSVTLDGTPVRGVNSPHLQSLLAYLVLHRDYPQARSHMAFTFWPNATDAQARNNLRKRLFDFRRVLPRADLFLSINAAAVQWRSDAPYTLDVDDFEQAAAASDPSTLETAIALYRGDLMPDCLDDWILPERERLRDTYAAILERLVEFQEAQRDYRSAIDNAQRLLRHDPWHEPTYRRLIRLYATTGNRASAWRVYHTCLAVFKQEFNVAPSVETCEEYAQLFKQPAGSMGKEDRSASRPP